MRTNAYYESMTFEQINSRLATSGLMVHAALHSSDEYELPILQNGSRTETLLLIGNAGSSIWSTFYNSPEYADGNADPLDRWSRRLGEMIASEFAGEAIFPFTGPPFLPFLSWAKYADQAVNSPLGLSLHPDYGLWFGYRFALALSKQLDGLPEMSKSANLCENCSSKPCLHSCPVNAFSDNEYHFMQCVKFLSEYPMCECNQSGCAARHACPIGQRYKYKPEHAQFHMQAYLAKFCLID